MLSDGDSREVNARAGALRVDRDVVAARARRARPVTPRRHPGRGGLRLPLAAALLVPALVQDDRRRARAFRAAPAAGAAAAGDRARRARLLPGLLGAGRGQRPRVADDARRAARRLPSSSTGTRSGPRARSSPTGSTSPSAPIRTRRSTGGSRCSSPAWTRPGSRCGRSRRSAAASSARSSSTGSRFRRSTWSASSNGGWDVLMYTLDFERITAEKIGGVAWIARRGSRSGGSTTRAGELARLRGELEAARLLSFRAADVLDRGLPGSATSAMAKLSGARVAQRVGDAVVDLLGLDGLAEGADAPHRGPRRGALPRLGRVDDRRRNRRGAAARDRTSRAGAA